MSAGDVDKSLPNHLHHLMTFVCAVKNGRNLHLQVGLFPSIGLEMYTTTVTYHAYLHGVLAFHQINLLFQYQY